MIEYTVQVYEDRTEWRLNGQLHREHGPAIEYASGNKEWWLNGQEYSEQDFNKLINCTELSVAEIEQLLGYKVKIVDK
jgi:hypothetical protein